MSTPRQVSGAGLGWVTLDDCVAHNTDWLTAIAPALFRRTGRRPDPAAAEGSTHD